MAQDYIEISTTGNISGALKYAILASSGNVDGFQTQTEVSSTLNGDTVISMGVGKQVWDFNVIVNYGGAASGWGKLSDLKALFTSTSSTVLKLRDQSSTVYDALLINKGDYQPKPLTVKWHEIDSKWVVRVNLKQA